MLIRRHRKDKSKLERQQKETPKKAPVKKGASKEKEDKSVEETK